MFDLNRHNALTRVTFSSGVRRLGKRILHFGPASAFYHGPFVLSDRSVIMGYLPRSEAHSAAAAATLAELAAPFRESTLFTMAQVSG